MIRALLPYLVTAIVAVILRDVECFVAAKIFCWRKRRQSQREAKQTRELRQLEAQWTAAEQASQETEKNARIAKLMAAASKVPYPRLLSGPLVITPRCEHELILITRQLVTNFNALGKTVCSSNWEKN
jgi:hypothetical protein